MVIEIEKGRVRQQSVGLFAESVQRASRAVGSNTHLTLFTSTQVGSDAAPLAQTLSSACF